MNHNSRDEEYFMKKAIELADKGKGFVNPNPLVGAVIVKNRKIIGEGYHECFGEHHAEVNAFNNATEDVEGADMYVTLEPCSHYGKTPPCALKIIEKKIKRVFISQLDPNPLVNRQGVKLLEDAGIIVKTGILEKESKVQNEIFLKYISKKIPFVAIKYAMTLDGKIATKDKDSKWITNEKSRAFVHELRNQYMAIMVGSNTVLLDDPHLDTRRNRIPSRNPIRIIIDPELTIPLESYVVKTANQQQTFIIVSIHVSKDKMKSYEDFGVQFIQMKTNPLDLKELLIKLGERKIDGVLIEGGSYLLGTAIEQKIVDKAYVFIAPKIVGGQGLSPISGQGVSLMKDAYRLEHIKKYMFDEDIMMEGYFIKGEENEV